jgi:hypothetical protein
MLSKKGYLKPNFQQMPLVKVDYFWETVVPKLCLLFLHSYAGLLIVIKDKVNVEAMLKTTAKHNGPPVYVVRTQFLPIFHVTRSR